MFESIKAGELSKELAQHSFRVLIKLLLTKTMPNEHKMVKPAGKRGAGIDTDEEEK